MNHLRMSKKLLLIVIFTAITLTFYFQGRARGSLIQVTPQQDIVSYLQERYEQENVPVTSISILNQSPLQLEITLQSASDGMKGTSDDPINYHKVEREIILAQQKGYVIESFNRNIVNKLGERIAGDTTWVHTEYMILDNPPSRVSDNTTETLVSERLNLYGLTLTNINLSSFEGIQTLTTELSAASLEEANSGIKSFLWMLPQLIKDVNSRGAQIQVCEVQLRDENGNLLLNYMLDSQLRSQSWWTADNFPIELGSEPAEVTTP